MAYRYAYIKGNTIYYVVTLEFEVDKSTISEEDLEEIKSDCIIALRGEPMIATRKKELIKEDIHIVYIYKDSRGEECMRVTIAPQEMFQ